VDADSVPLAVRVKAVPVAALTKNLAMSVAVCALAAEKTGYIVAL